MIDESEIQSYALVQNISLEEAYARLLELGLEAAYGTNSYTWSGKTRWNDLPWSEKLLSPKRSTCPTCLQSTTAYNRPLSASIASGLVRLALLAIRGRLDDYHHVSTFDRSGGRSGEISKLLHWGFIEELLNMDTTKRTSGYWRATAWGRLFVTKKLTAPSHALIDCHNRLIALNGPLVDVNHCLATKFDYETLLKEP